MNRKLIAMRQGVIAVLLLAGIGQAWADDPYLGVPPTAASAGPAFAQPGQEPSYAVSPYASVLPTGAAPVQDPRFGQASAPSPTPSAALPTDRGAAVVAASTAASTDRPIESTWYFREDAFSWNERLEGKDFVNEYGPLSTLGYLRRNGIERFRFELFGGSVAYDGCAMYDDGSTEPYHQSNGTDYLGLRGEYDLLFEPGEWCKVRFLAGLGARFWIRDLNNATTPSGAFVTGYQETWWTFYPYLGVETKDSPDPGPKFFASARIGATPLTYQYATYFDSAVWPRCGLTGRVELGMRLQRFSLSAVGEATTWRESAAVEDAYGSGVLQPASRMLTVGGQIGYTF
ncbi:MAG: hypothetical protein LLG00_08725 [Planctomycetaceae bacterium]|nr:hypothetical protein [Planctomycetaceae bacterium]